MPGSDSSKRTLDERYELLERVGIGGMAEVWRATDTRLARDVAVKLLSKSSATDPSRRRKIEREAKALAAASDPAIVAVYDYGEATDSHGDVQPYLVMELVDGPDLHKYLADRGPLPAAEATEIMSGVLTAVERAHGAGVVHGDLKPANVFIGPHGPKVGDFGVARILDEETGTTTVAATPTFAAPEVLKGERASAASDVYSAGCMLFELLAGRPPYEGANGWDIASKHIDAPVPMLHEFRPDVSKPLEDAVRRAMDKAPKNRHPSAGAFSDELRSIPIVAATETVPGAGAVAGSPERTEALPRKQPDHARVALLGPLAGVWDRISAGGRAGRKRFMSARPNERALLIGLVALLLLIGFLMMRPKPPADVAMPNVVGKSVQDAKGILRTQGLKTDEVSYVAITKGTPGLVEDTIPNAKAMIAPGTRVHLIVGAPARTPEPVRTVAPAQQEERNRDEGEKRKNGDGKGKDNDDRD